jgi:hypothetical protein
LGGAQEKAVPAQTPLTQMSVAVHELPSLQAVPSVFA